MTEVNKLKCALLCARFTARAANGAIARPDDAWASVWQERPFDRIGNCDSIVAAA